MKDLWTEKYRPKNIADYVFRDDNQKEQVNAWLKSDAIPHLIFSGAPGTGKTTLAKVLLNELDVDWGDVLEINASRENSVDTVRDKITNCSATIPFGPFKYVLLDEADYMTPNAQAILRGMMEQYVSTVRFILTCNYPNRIIPAIHSRCQGFHIEHLDKTEFAARIATILMDEKIDLDIDTLDTYVKASYPDMRKTINLCQQNSQSGKLIAPHKSETSGPDWRLEMVELFKANKIRDARKLVCSQARPEEYEDVFKFLYTNLELISDNEDKQEEAILVIRDGLVKHTTCADPEINLSATMINLQLLSKTS